MCRQIALFTLVAAACLWAQPAAAEAVFSETFDGPTLPDTLTYSEVPPNMVWSTSGGELLADSDGTLNTTITAITNDGFAAPIGLRTVYSLDLGIPDGASVGSYNVGLQFGGYRAVFHPGYVPIPGAFRMEGGYGVSNQNMGFVPKTGVLHHIDVETFMIGTSLAVDVTVSGLGTDDLPHTFNFSFLDTTPNLGIGQFGARRSGGGSSSDAMFDNFQVLHVPEPSALALAALGLLGLCCIRRRRCPKL